MSEPITIQDLSAVSQLVVNDPKMFEATEKVKISNDQYTNTLNNINSTNTQIEWLQQRLTQLDTEQKQAELELQNARNGLKEVLQASILTAAGNNAAPIARAGIAITEMPSETPTPPTPKPKSEDNEHKEK